MKASKKHLEGRTIVKVDMRPFVDGRGGTAHNPCLTLDDGQVVWFVTEETDAGVYGTSIRTTGKAGKNGGRNQ